MGMPEIVVSFAEASETVVERSAREIVAMILSDETAQTNITKIYRESDIVAADWTAANAALIGDALKYGAAEVLAVRAQAAIADTLALLKSQVWDWLIYPAAQSADNAAIVTWISAQRADGKTFKAILAGATAPNHEGIVNFTTTGIKNGATSISGGDYCATIAGILASTPLDQSATFHELDNITEIAESADPDADIDAGKLIIVYDREKFRLARAVTSLTSRTGVSAEFKKIKHMDGCDVIARDIRNTFEDEYVGQVANNYDNKQVFVASVNSYLKNIEGSVLDAEFDNACEIDVDTQRAYLEELGIDTSGMSDMDVLKANTDSAVFVSMDIRLLDAMEDLALKVSIH